MFNKTNIWRLVSLFVGVCFDDPDTGIRAIELVHEIREFPSLPSLLGAPGSHVDQEVLNRVWSWTTSRYF